MQQKAESKKVLLVSYYWPPSGGAGVQRWLKLSKYLATLGCEVHVVTVDERYASYTDIDTSLEHDIAPNVRVYKTKSLEPNNIYAAIAGKKNVPKGGFSNVPTSALQRLATRIRSNFFIPDPRRPWNTYAYRIAKQIICKHNIRTVITTSPPHSTQLVGLHLKKKLGVHWIADLRDPWTDIYYYPLLKHSALSHRINASLEKKVVENCDNLVTVSQGCLDLFQRKTDTSLSSKSCIVPNGYDRADFASLRYTKAEKSIVITYTGTMSDAYNPEVVFSAIAKIKDSVPVRLQLIGTVSNLILNMIDTYQLSDNVVNIPPVPHNQIVQYQIDADILLLVIPDVENAQGILTGKLFEYLASGVPILCIGPKDGDAAKIIDEAYAGRVFSRDEGEAIVQYIADTNKMQVSGKEWKERAEVAKYSRIMQASSILELIK